MTENIVTGKKYRILTDAANDVWDRISFWAKASDVQYDDNTTAEANKAVAILKRNASYTIGTVAYEPSAPSWVLLRCTQAGTTAAVIPSTYSTISSVGTVITDGTARFTVYDVRPSGTLSNSEYQVPAMSLVNGLDAELTANGNKFYFDYQNDKYGYNTSASREAATFVPFGGSSEDVNYSLSGSASGFGSRTSYATITTNISNTEQGLQFFSYSNGVYTCVKPCLILSELHARGKTLTSYCYARGLINGAEFTTTSALDSMTTVYVQREISVGNTIQYQCRSENNASYSPYAAFVIYILRSR